MASRIDLFTLEPEAYKAMRALEDYMAASGLDRKLYELVKIRASQINKCAFCINMHTRDARKLGETEQRIYALNAWEEGPFFTPQERAALALTEAVTLLADTNVPDEVYLEAAKHFDEHQLAQLIMAIVAINGWNRICVATRRQPD